MVHRPAYWKFCCREIYFSNWKLLSNYIQLVNTYKHWSNWELIMYHSNRRKEKWKKCIVCNILTSTATGSFNEHFSVIEVNDQKSGDVYPKKMCTVWMLKSWELDSAICGEREEAVHSTCKLRNRSPFLTPPCSILAPRLLPVTPSLQSKEQNWKETAVL